MWYPDKDKDGFGDKSAPPTSACIPPEGYVADHTDCADDDARANPAQSVMQESPVKGTGGGDFNCDGVQAPQLNESIRTCEFPCSFASGPGWLTQSPECGAVGTWLLGCEPGAVFGECAPQTESRGKKCL